MNRLQKISRRTVQVPIHFYRKFISPLKPPSCRFYPTCSQYALEAIEIHGITKGSWLAVKRISKCHPFHPGGMDPVPSAKHYQSSSADNEQKETSSSTNIHAAKPIQ